MFRYVLLGTMCITFISANSQQESDIDPVEIKIVKDYNVFIEEATKIHEPISYYPKFKEKATQKKMSYSLPDRIEQFKFEPSSVEPISYKQRNTLFQNTNFVRLGFGSSLNPLFEWSHHHEKSTTPSRIHIFHHSAWYSPDSFQKYSETKGEAEFTKSIKDWIIKPKIDVQHKYYNFFGNINESGFKNAADRNYMNGGIVLTIQREKNTLKTLSVLNTLNANYGMDRLGMFDTLKNNHESYLQLKSDLSYKLNENLSLGLQTDIQYYNLTVDTFTDKWIIQGMPQVEYRTKEFKFLGSFNLTQTMTNSKPIFYVLPNIYGEMQLIPNLLNIYANWNKELDINRMQNNLNANPFALYTNKLLPNTLIENRTAGVKGVFKGISFQAFLNQKVLKDAMLFKNDAVNPRFLSAVTEQNMTVNNLTMDISYLREEKWSAFIRGELFIYSLDRTPSIVYNLPEQKLTIGANLRASKKLNLYFNGFALGGVKTMIGTVETSNPLLFDLNIGGEFHISKNFYIFANGNNLLNSKIAQQIGFPSFGINGQGGIRITY